MIRRATSADAEALSALAAETFPLATTPGTDPADIAAFIETNLSLASFVGYLADPRRILLVEEGPDDLVGYTMVVIDEPYDQDVRDAVAAFAGEAVTAELSKVYLRAGAHGSGVAAALVTASAEAAAERGAEVLWLGVNQHNPRAVAFYRKVGFEQIGTKSFHVGQRHEHDFVLARRLAA